MKLDGMQLSMRKDRDRQPRAVVRIYSEESVAAMNQIAMALNKRPSAIIQEWIAQVHAEMVDNGQIILDDPEEEELTG